MHILIQPNDTAQRVFNGMLNNSYWNKAVKRDYNRRKMVNGLFPLVNGSDYDAWSVPEIPFGICHIKTINRLLLLMTTACGIPPRLIMDKKPIEIKEEEIKTMRKINGQGLWLQPFNKENKCDTMVTCSKILKYPIMAVVGLTWFEAKPFGRSNECGYLIPVLPDCECSINDIVSFVHIANELVIEIITERKQEMTNVIFSHNMHNELYDAFINDFYIRDGKTVERCPGVVKLSTIAAMLFQLYGEEKALFKLHETVNFGLKVILEERMRGFHV